MANEYVQVDNCNWLHEAHVVKSVLEAEGIEVSIPDEYFAGVQPLYGNAIGGIRVMVRAADALRAREVLAATAISPSSQIESSQA